MYFYIKLKSAWMRAEDNVGQDTVSCTLFQSQGCLLKDHFVYNRVASGQLFYQLVRTISVDGWLCCVFGLLVNFGVALTLRVAKNKSVSCFQDIILYWHSDISVWIQRVVQLICLIQAWQGTSQQSPEMCDISLLKSK